MSVVVLVILTILSAPASAADPPFFIREMMDSRDVGSVNENFRAVADAARRAQDGVDTIKDDVRNDDNTWIGTNIFESSFTLRGTATINGTLVVNSSPSLPGSWTWTSTMTTSLNWRVSCPSGFFEVFRSSDIGFARSFGCMQTAERASDTHLNAMNDCFTAFGARLPTLNEFSIACSNFASTMTDETDDNEWLDGGGAAQVGLIVQGATACNAAGESGQGNTIAYRCFLQR